MDKPEFIFFYFGLKFGFHFLNWVLLSPALSKSFCLGVSSFRFQFDSDPSPHSMTHANELKMLRIILKLLQNRIKIDPVCSEKFFFKWYLTCTSIWPDMVTIWKENMMSYPMTRKVWQIQPNKHHEIRKDWMTPRYVGPISSWFIQVFIKLLA